MPSLVKDLMTTPVVTVGPTTAFKALVACLAEHQISAVPVVDDTGQVLGVVSEADLLLKAEHPDPNADRPLVWTKHRRAEHDKAAATTAHDLMTVAVVSISPEATAAQAARRLHTAHIKQLPVVDTRGRLVGILSRSDLLKVFNRPDETIRRQIINNVIVGQCMLNPDHFFIQVHQGLAILEGRVETRSLLPWLVHAVHHVDGVVQVQNRLSYDLDDHDSAARAMTSPWMRL